jgi:hypothetical protein
MLCHLHIYIAQIKLTPWNVLIIIYFNLMAKKKKFWFMSFCFDGDSRNILSRIKLSFWICWYKDLPDAMNVFNIILLTYNEWEKNYTVLPYWTRSLNYFHVRRNKANKRWNAVWKVKAWGKATARIALWSLMSNCWNTSQTLCKLTELHRMYKTGMIWELRK